MDDPVFKSKYQKYKYKVKVWEKSFRQKNGRIPSKHDIREAPLNIREAYKMYYKLKSSFLEDTLNDVLDEDGFDLSMDSNNCSGMSDILSPADDCSMMDVGGDGDADRMLPSLSDITAATSAAAMAAIASYDASSLSAQSSATSADLMFSNIDELAPHALTNLRNIDDRHVLREFEAEPAEDSTIAALNANAWGPDLKRAAAAKQTSAPAKAMAKSQEVVRKVVTEKLFRNASFSKRNPRKSLARGASGTGGLAPGLNGLTDGGRFQSVLPDLETILMEKAKKQQDADAASASQSADRPMPTPAIDGAAATLRTVVDQGWLNRCSAANGVLNGDGVPETPFIEMAGTSVATAPAAAPVRFGMTNLNVPLPAAPAEPQTTMPAAKETYAQNTYADDLREGDDDDDEIGEVIENSEDESSQKATASSTRHVLKKRKVHDVRPPPAPLQPRTDSVEPVIHPDDTADSAEPAAGKAAKTPARRKSSASRKAAKPKTSPKLTATAQRRTKRAVRKSSQSVQAAEAAAADAIEQDEFDEENADDSDKDPEFDVTSELRRGRRPAIKSNHSEAETSDQGDNDDDDDDEKENPRSAKNVPPKKAAPVKRKTKAVKAADAKLAAAEDDGDAVDKDEGPQDYVIEFGTEYTQSVPRVNVAELQANTQAFQDYVYTAVTGGPAPATASATNEAIHIPLTKRELERAKFEARVDAGKVNENFVRINIQKKKFSRGHKTHNFSKFKKTEWRKKKVANALAGPEMNMNGCDGGFLVCFQCGQQGHFASDCKIQSDRLLPLDADAEVSEFPTLAEVNAMVQEKAHLQAAAKRGDDAMSQAVQQTNPNGAEEESANESGDSDDYGDSSDDGGPENAVDTPTPTTEPASIEKPARDAPTFIGHQIPADFRRLAGYDSATVANSESIQPLYALNPDGSAQPPTPDVMAALRQFGHTAFRKGQDRAVMRILSGLPTLVTLSTGSGKSLCYQLPAYMFRQQRSPCITLVISPLVSLMEDQVHDVPAFLNAQCLHTGQSKTVRERIMAEIRAGTVDVLLVSPEAVVAGERATGFGSLLRELPPIAFACIDEAHCMSQWSHNFRPSYLMICRVLQEKLKVRTVLGLTATATRPTRESIVRHLAIPDGVRGVISDVPLPSNLLLTVSRDENRDQALVRLLRSERFAAFRSIIVYCTRRDECERVAGLIRMCFQEEEKQLREEAAAEALAANRKRKRQKSLVEAYHAGLGASRRRRIQNEFMRSDLKIVVATIAFGMGINKADIRAVVHFNMPMTYENYTQEVGRAGRDGQPSHCHLFLDAQRRDLVELRRHVYANSIDRHVIRRLLQKVFVPCACKHNLVYKEYQAEVEAVQDMCWDEAMEGDGGTEEGKSDGTGAAAVPAPPQRRKCPGHEAAFSVEQTVQALDIPEENIATLLCYLELHEQRLIQVLSKAYCSCKVMSYGGPGVLRTAARTCAPLAMAIALDLKRGVSHQTSTLIEFNVIDVAAAIGWDSGIVKHQLKNMEWTSVNGQPKRSAISVQFSDLGFRVRSPGDLGDGELDHTLDLLYERVSGQERMQLLQLQNVFNGLSGVAFVNCVQALNKPEEAEAQSEKLKVHVRDYFQRQGVDESIEITDEQDTKAVSDEQLICDVRTMIDRYPDNQFTGRTLARIFHGVPSPVYPAQIWFRCNFWRVHTHVDFNRIVRLANAEIVKRRIR